MKVDVTLLSMPQNYLARCGIYFSAFLDSPFLYTVKENVSCVYPYRCLMYHGITEYIEEWSQKDFAKKVGNVLNGYNLDFSSFNIHNGDFAIANFSRLDQAELANFKHNVLVTMKWLNKSALIRKLQNLDDLLR